MPESVWTPDTQRVIDAAKTTTLFPSSADWRDQWIYFLMVDRFNNPNAPIKHQPFDDPQFNDYQGGTFSGVQAQLPYIRELGAGAIWLSPVLKNLKSDPSYHGYGIHDFLAAEPRFATDPLNADAELRALVDAAHEQGLYVIFDIVLNHTGDVFWYQNGGAVGSFSDSPQPIEWRDGNGQAQPNLPVIDDIRNPSRDAFIWPRELQQNGLFRRQGNMGGTSDDTIGDFSSLKQFLTADRTVQGTLIRAYQYVIARFDVDGFRIDTLRYLKGGLPQLFGNAMREFALSVGKKNFFTFGEVFDQNAEQDIARFIGRNTSDANDLVGVDSALDYPLLFALKPVVKGFAPPTAVANMYQNRKRVEQDVLSTHGDATRYFVTFLDNHDLHERLRFVQPGDEHRLDDQVTLGLACLLTLPGIPCIYYGTEQGLHGRGSDAAVREALWGGPSFENKSVFYLQIAHMSTVRSAKPALRYGRFYFRPVSGDGHGFGISPFNSGVLAYSRILNDEEIVVVANTDPNTPQSIHVIIDSSLNAADAIFSVLYSNKPGHGAITTRVGEIAGATVLEVDGSTNNGAVHAIQVTLEPLEVQILGR